MRVESLDKEVCLHASYGLIKVSRQTETVRTLFFQVFSQAGYKASSTHETYVEVFIKGLRSTETTRVTGTQIDVFCGVITQVYAWTENEMMD